MTGPLPGLPDREREVLTVSAEGTSNRPGAVLSPVTVRNHVRSMLATLQVSDRRRAMLRASAAREGAPPDRSAERNA